MAKRIIGLSCGSKGGNCETYIKITAKGAAEFGVETELIRAVDLKILPCRGCGGCSPRGNSIPVSALSKMTQNGYWKKPY